MSEKLILWQPAPSKLTLSPPEIHVWCATLDQPAFVLERLWKTLTQDEQDRASRFHFERDRTRFIAGRGILRNILSQYLEITPCQIQFFYGKQGKPFLLHSAINFNLSHSQEMAIYAIAFNRNIGIDLEAVRFIPDIVSVAKSFFSESDYLTFKTLSDSDQQLAFFYAWTRKEAFLKAVGDGLYQPPHQIQVSFLPNQPAQLLKIENNPKAIKSWSLVDFIPTLNYIGALVFEAKNTQFSYWQWSINSDF